MKDFILSGIVLGILLWNCLTKYDNPSDFQDYYHAAKKFYNQEDIYSIDQLLKAGKNLESPLDIFKPEMFTLLEELSKGAGSYIYPPTFAFLLIPLSFLDYPTASFLFSLGNYFAFLGFLWILYRLHSPHFPSPSTYWTVVFWSLLVNFRFLENHINNNQVSFLLLFLILLSIYSKNNLLSGLSLSLATVIKITPGIFFFYFFWKKRWSVLFWGLFFLGFWILLPGIFHWEENLNHIQTWIDLVLKSALSSPLFRSWQNNQSLIATLAKYFLEFADPIHQYSKGLPFLSLKIHQVQYIFYGFLMGFGLHLLYQVYLHEPRPSESKVLSFLFILSVIFSGISWIHSFSFLFFPVFFVIREWVAGGLSQKQKYAFLIFSSMVLFTNRNWIGKEGESWALMLSVLLYAAFLLYFLVSSIEYDGWDFPIPTPKKPQGIPKIAVDARPFAYGMTGNSRYLAEVLQILGTKNQEFSFYLYSHKPIHSVFHPLLKLPAIRLISESSIFPGPIWLHTVFPYLARRDQVDCLWGTLQILPAWGKFCRMVVNFHDLNVHVAPQTMALWNYWQHKLFCKRTLQQADSVFCLSQSTEKDIHQYYPFASQKTLVIYPGVRKIQNPNPPDHFSKFQKFLFTLGTLEPRKNLKTLIQAYQELKKEFPQYPYSLVIGGRSGWGKEESQLEQELQQGLYESIGIYFLHNPPEEVLGWLYQNCSGFLFPSIHEGFGLPLLEAMQEKKNCIASDIPVFREFCEEGVDILVSSPQDPLSWKNALIQFVKSPPKPRKWNPNQWTWMETSKKIEQELKKQTHAI